MARMRTIKPEACTSESLAEVDRAVRWTFAALWTHCDDEGRAAWNPRLVKAALYPLDDTVTVDVVRADIAELVRVGAVCMYTVDGREYLHVPAWSDHQHPNRKVDSKLPPCPATDHSATAHAQRSEDTLPPQPQSSPVVVVGVVDGEGDVGGAAATPTALKRGTRLPDEWKPAPTDRDWTLERISSPAAGIELEKFRNYWHAKTGKDATKLDWGKVWRNWVLNSNTYKAGTPDGGSITDQRVTEGRNLATELRREQAGHLKEIRA